jgi:IS30 family transposase
MGWSPELVAGRIGIDKPGLSISHEAIYQYIYAEKRNLIENLPMKRWSRKRRGYSRRHHKVLIPNRRDISLRPAVVAERTEIGHWEADSAISRASKAALNVLSERVSRLTLLTKLSRKTAEETSRAITERLKCLPPRWRKSITYDNGLENTEHDKTDAVLKTESYFCAPYHSWEKGTVENSIGLVRRWLPKKTDLEKVPDDKIVEIESWLNNRPRKCLGYRTPWGRYSINRALRLQVECGVQNLFISGGNPCRLINLRCSLKPHSPIFRQKKAPADTFWVSTRGLKN